MIPIDALDAAVLERWTQAVMGEPISLQIVQDEEWSPRTQATLVISDTVDLSGGLGPGGFPLWKWQGNTLTVRLRKRYSELLTVAELTAAYGGDVAAVTADIGGSVEAMTRTHITPWNVYERLLPLSEATNLWSGEVAAVTADHGGSIAALTDALRQPGGSYLPPTTERLQTLLHIRSVTPDPSAGTVTYRLVSADIALHDYRRTATTVWAHTYTSLRALVEYIVYLIGLSTNPLNAPVLSRAGGNVAITAGAEWRPGMSAWEFLHPILESVGWTLYADLDGVLQFHPRTVTLAPHDLDAATNLTGYEAETDYANAYFDGAIVEYTDAAEDDPTARYDVFVMPGGTRIMHETRPGVRKDPGAAEQLVTRSRTRALVGSAEATIQPLLAPLDRVTIQLPPVESGGGPIPQTRYGTIRSITHDHPAAETRLELRDLTNTY